MITDYGLTSIVIAVCGLMLAFTFGIGAVMVRDFHRAGMERVRRGNAARIANNNHN